MITPQEIANDILSRGDLMFIDVVKFYNRRDYEMASNLHTDTLALGEEILDVDELNEIEEPIREYSIRDLSRDEYATTVLANSSISIDDIWDKSDGELSSVVVRILIDKED